MHSANRRKQSSSPDSSPGSAAETGLWPDLLDDDDDHDNTFWRVKLLQGFALWDQFTKLLGHVRKFKDLMGTTGDILFVYDERSTDSFRKIVSDLDGNVQALFQVGRVLLAKAKERLRDSADKLNQVRICHFSSKYT